MQIVEAADFHQSGDELTLAILCAAVLDVCSQDTVLSSEATSYPPRLIVKDVIFNQETGLRGRLQLHPMDKVA